MGRFVKFCKREHNIARGCNTIQIGTLRYYREMDPYFSIADLDEGAMTFVVHDYDASKAPPELRALLPIQGFNISGSDIVITIPNLYVFCLTMVDDPRADLVARGKSIDPRYDSWYFIDDMDTFVRKLNVILSESLSLTDVEPAFLDKELNRLPLPSLRQLRMPPVSKPVAYGGKNVAIENTQLVGAPAVDPVQQMVFTKDAKFVGQNEFRIAFFLTHPRYGVIPVRTEPKLVPLKLIGNEITGGESPP